MAGDDLQMGVIAVVGSYGGEHPPGGGVFIRQDLRLALGGGSLYLGTRAYGEVCPHDLRHAEINEFCVPIAAHKNVGRLDVPVNDAGFMGAPQPLCDLPKPAQLFGRGGGAFPQNLDKFLGIHILHHHVGAMVRVLAHVVDGHDIGMADPRAQDRFTAKAGQDDFVFQHVVALD